MALSLPSPERPCSWTPGFFPRCCGGEAHSCFPPTTSSSSNSTSLPTTSGGGPASFRRRVVAARFPRTTSGGGPPPSHDERWRPASLPRQDRWDDLDRLHSTEVAPSPPLLLAPAGAHIHALDLVRDWANGTGSSGGIFPRRCSSAPLHSSPIRGMPTPLDGAATGPGTGVHNLPSPALPFLWQSFGWHTACYCLCLCGLWREAAGSILGVQASTSMGAEDLDGAVRRGVVWSLLRSMYVQIGSQHDACIGLQLRKC